MPTSGVRLIGMVTSALSALALSACGSSGPPPDALSGKSPAEVLRLALADARKAATMRYTITTQSGSAKQSVAGDANADGGAVVVTNSTGVLRVVVIGDTAYIQSDAAASPGRPGRVVRRRHRQRRQMDLGDVCRQPVRRFGDGRRRSRRRWPSSPRVGTCA